MGHEADHLSNPERETMHNHRSARTRNRAERPLFIALAGLSAAVSLLDLFGFLTQFPWLSNRIPTITLLLVSLVVVKLVIDQSRFFPLIESSLTDIHTNRLASATAHLDPRLRDVFGDYIESLLKRVEIATREKKLTYNDVYLFRHFFRRTLELYPRSRFYATSLPSSKYFWKNDYSEQAIANFIAHGGQMERVFFLSRSIPQLGKEERDILLTQCEMGVAVYVSKTNAIPKKLRRLFAVEANNLIGWEVFTGPTGEIDKITATSDQSELELFKHVFDELKQLTVTHRITLADLRGASEETSNRELETRGY